MTGIRVWPSEALASGNCDRGTTVRKVSDHCWLTVPYGQSLQADRLVANLHIEAKDAA